MGLPGGGSRWGHGSGGAGGDVGSLGNPAGLLRPLGRRLRRYNSVPAARPVSMRPSMASRGGLCSRSAASDSACATPCHGQGAYV